MLNNPIELSDVIGKLEKYQIIATISAALNEGILGICMFYMQFLFVEVTLYWDWDAASENKTTFSSVNCKMHDVINLNFTSNTSKELSRIVYESRYMTSSLTEKFGFVCESTWLISLTKMLPLAGSLLGSLIMGPFCEKFGRRLISLSLQVVLLISQLSMLFAQSYYMFAVACAVTGFCLFPLFVVSVVQVTEIVPMSWRPWYGTVIRYGIVTGQLLISGVAWLLKDWFGLQLAVTILVALSIPLVWYVLDSPAWLIVRGRKDDARSNVMTIVKRNRKNMEQCEQKADLWIKAMQEKQDNKTAGEMGKITNLFKNRIITKYTICLSLSVSLPFFVFLGTIINLETFGSGMYQDITIITGLSVVGLIVSAVFLKKYSIRKLQIFCLLLGAVDSLIYVFTYEYDVARSVTGCLLRAVMIPVTCTNMVYMAELFPTTVRIVGSGFVLFFLVVMESFSPFVKDLGERTYTYVPFILFAAATFTSACLIMLLPETKNRPLIQTIEELVKWEERKLEQDIDSIAK